MLACDCSVLLTEHDEFNIARAAGSVSSTLQQQVLSRTSRRGEQPRVQLPTRRALQIPHYRLLSFAIYTTAVQLQSRASPLQMCLLPNPGKFAMVVTMAVCFAPNLFECRKNCPEKGGGRMWMGARFIDTRTTWVEVERN